MPFLALRCKLQGMFKPFSLFVGLRYSFAKKYNFFLSFVSLISVLGVSLGVMVLIVALSIINGSIATMREETLKSVPHVTIDDVNIELNWEDYIKRSMSNPDVVAAAPYLEGEAVLRFQGANQFASLRGVIPTLESEVVDNPNQPYRELLQLLEETENGIILGTQLAGALNIYNSAEVNITTLGSLLQRSLGNARGYEVIGFADFGFYNNNNIALINLESSKKLFANNSGIDLRLRLKVNDVLRAEEIATSVLPELGDKSVIPWNEAQASLFNALNMEKILTSFMLLMIVVIGAVNIVSTLVMVVSDKSADIAIIRAMGASRASVVKIFVVQGMVAGLLGTFIGALLGVALANYITKLSLLLERFINSIFDDRNIYLISHLQTFINFSEVLLVCVAAFIICFLATLYPAYRASKIQPAEVLRYE